eukprot:NODE_190_length_2372_cov_46.162584_g184_i0.p1 GENE.NODE_190_length_2372_cov_46.162584_g184_i0~~NODE_190_length_2372_cov_46.162584_g184_i0.p1  ORF type:complete len:787 (-),score=182.61 NODE_190_length_2372_cov_46.162584_g184_i0:10-2199(-)
MAFVSVEMDLVDMGRREESDIFNSREGTVDDVDEFGRREEGVHRAVAYGFIELEEAHAYAYCSMVGRVKSIWEGVDMLVEMLPLHYPGSTLGTVVARGLALLAPQPFVELRPASAASSVDSLAPVLLDVKRVESLHELATERETQLRASQAQMEDARAAAVAAQLQQFVGSIEQADAEFETIAAGMDTEDAPVEALADLEAMEMAVDEQTHGLQDEYYASLLQYAEASAVAIQEFEEQLQSELALYSEQQVAALEGHPFTSPAEALRRLPALELATRQRVAMRDEEAVIRKCITQEALSFTDHMLLRFQLLTERGHLLQPYACAVAAKPCAVHTLSMQATEPPSPVVADDTPPAAVPEAFVPSDDEAPVPAADFLSPPASDAGDKTPTEPRSTDAPQEADAPTTVLDAQQAPRANATPTDAPQEATDDQRESASTADRPKEGAPASTEDGLSPPQPQSEDSTTTQLTDSVDGSQATGTLIAQASSQSAEGPSTTDGLDTVTEETNAPKTEPQLTDQLAEQNLLASNATFTPEPATDQFPGDAPERLPDQPTAHTSADSSPEAAPADNTGTALSGDASGTPTNAAAADGPLQQLSTPDVATAPGETPPAAQSAGQSAASENVADGAAYTADASPHAEGTPASGSDGKQGPVTTATVAGTNTPSQQPTAPTNQVAGSTDTDAESHQQSNEEQPTSVAATGLPTSNSVEPLSGAPVEVEGTGSESEGAPVYA